MLDRERAELEARLRETEARSHAIMESMAEGVVTLHTDGTIVDLNSAALGVFGYDREELIGSAIGDLVPPRYRDVFEGVMAHLRGLGEFRGFVVDGVALRKDGSERILKISLGDVQLGGERVFTAIVRDMTERKRISDALRASELQLRQITDAVPALIAYIDADCRFQFHNKAYEEFFGKTAGEVDGLTLAEVLGDDVFKVLKPRVDEVLSGYPVRYEREHRTAEGAVKDLSGQFIPRYGDGDQEGKVVGFYSMVTDITSLKRVNRMKSEFVSTVSHELRTPLTSIRGSLGLIAGGVAGALPPAAQVLVDIAKSNCERLIRLINDILDTEKIESGRMRFESEAIALRPLVAQALEANQGFAAQHGVNLALEPGAAPAVLGDADRLAQVVTNLVSNAAKFSPRGADVAVRISAAAGRVRVEVRDRGPGIPEEFRARIFQKFSQADSSDARLKGGTGLGLSISKAIVEQMGGAMGFETVPGVCTTFHFELPALEMSLPEAA